MTATEQTTQLAEQQRALLDRYEPLFDKAQRQQKVAEDRFMDETERLYGLHGPEALALATLVRANDLVEYYRGLLMEIRYASELSDLAHLGFPARSPSWPQTG